MKLIFKFSVNRRFAALFVNRPRHKMALHKNKTNASDLDLDDDGFVYSYLIKWMRQREVGGSLKQPVYK